MSDAGHACGIGTNTLYDLASVLTSPVCTSGIQQWLQIVMQLLDNLEGVSLSTYPKHPVSILSRMTVKCGLSEVRFSIDEEVHTSSGVRFHGRAHPQRVAVIHLLWE